MNKFLVLVGCLFLIGCGDEGGYQYHLRQLHNEARHKVHAQSLFANSRLSQAAQHHADWMAKNRVLSHEESNFRLLWQYDTKEPWDRAAIYGSHFRFIGENIADGGYDEYRIFDMWMNSEGHRENILNSQYTDMGFGRAEASDGTVYWCIVFGGD